MNATIDLDAPWVKQYRFCRVCSKEVSAEALHWALRTYEAPACSPECVRVEELKRHACCELAKPLSRNCVCAYAIECPTHGEQHFGTHE